MFYFVDTLRWVMRLIINYEARSASQIDTTVTKRCIWLIFTNKKIIEQGS
jgi:hypothetical protein